MKAWQLKLANRWRGEYVSEVLNRLVRGWDAPKYLFAGKDAEFTGGLAGLRDYHN